MEVLTQGNACRLENISNIGNIAELKFDIWERFREHFVTAEQQSTATTSALISELESSNSDFKVTEGALQLISHLVKERNRKIVTEKKQHAIKSQSLKCEVCTFSFPNLYKANFIECHHIRPISQTGVRETGMNYPAASGRGIC